MQAIWTVNLLLSCLFLSLAIVGWRKHAYALATANALGVLLVVGFELVDYYLSTNKSDLLLASSAIGLVLFADVKWAWEGLPFLSERNSQSRVSSAPDGATFFVINDDDIFHREIDRIGGLMPKNRRTVLRLYQGGKKALTAGLNDHGQRKFEEVIALAPCAVGYTNLAAALLAQKKYDAAVIQADAALRLGPANFEGLMNRGAALDALERYVEAVDCYKQAAELQPNRWAPHLFQAQSLRRLSRWDAAIEACEKVLAIDSENLEAWYLKGLCLYKIMKYEEAKSCFEKSLSLKPDHALAHFNHGNVLLKMHLYAEAVESYTKALSLQPEYLEALNNRGIALGKLGNIDGAKRDYEHALRIKSDYHEAWLNLAVAHDVVNEKTKALEYYQEYLSIAPPHLQEQILLIKRRVEELSSKTAPAAHDASFHPVELSAHG
jgi:tetratricopeptide (TPR) repeat protein